MSAGKRSIRARFPIAAIRLGRVLRETGAALMISPRKELALKRLSLAVKSCQRKDCAAQKNPALIEGGITRRRWVLERSALSSTNSNLARFYRFGFRQVNRQKSLVDASPDL